MDGFQWELCTCQSRKNTSWIRVLVAAHSRSIITNMSTYKFMHRRHYIHHSSSDGFAISQCLGRHRERSQEVLSKAVSYISVAALNLHIVVWHAWHIFYGGPMQFSSLTSEMDMRLHSRREHTAVLGGKKLASCRNERFDLLECIQWFNSAWIKKLNWCFRQKFR